MGRTGNTNRFVDVDHIHCHFVNYWMFIFSFQILLQFLQNYRNSEKVSRTMSEEDKVQARLVAISSEADTDRALRGRWLKEKMDEEKLRLGITEDTVPTDEMIRRQILLPTSGSQFIEPITVWETTSGPLKLQNFKPKDASDEGLELVGSTTHSCVEKFEKEVEDPLPMISVGDLGREPREDGQLVLIDRFGVSR